MVGIRSQIISTVRNFACNALDTANGPLQWLNTGTRGGVPGLVWSQGVNRAAATALSCDPDRNNGGSGGNLTTTGYPNLEGLPPGQCPGVPYQISGIALVRDPNNVVIRELGYLTTDTGPLTRYGVELTTNNVVVVDSQGTVIGNLGNLPPGANNVVWQNGYPDISRTDGLPNEACDAAQPGSPLPEGSGDITYDGPDGNPVTEPFTIVGGPLITTPTGDLIIPVEFCIVSLCFDVELNLSTGDVAFNFGGSPGGEACCPETEEEGDGNPPNDDDPPPPENNVLLWGIKVNSAIADPQFTGTEKGTGTGPPIFLPDLGWVRFAVKRGGSTGWTSKTVIQSLSQMIQVPGTALAYAYDIFPRPGVTVAVKEVIVLEATTD